MILPGQSRHASRKLTNSLAEVQKGLGKSIVFLPLRHYRNHRLTSMVRGYHESDNGTERIWLDDTLPYAVQESIAAHELAHVMQEKEGYPHISSVTSSQGKPLVTSLERLAAITNNLVMDESADLWAINRGFDLKKVFGSIGIDSVISAINGSPMQKEAADWKAYHAGLRKLARELKQPKAGRDCCFIGEEAITQGMSLDYAALSLRMGRHGLFDSLDELWSKHWPVSRKMGKELADIVNAGGISTPEECRRTFEKILSFLKIPAPLIGIR